MAANALMEKVGQGQMFVPPAKVQQFIQDGWKVIQPADEIPVKQEPIISEAELDQPETLSVDQAVERLTKNEQPVRRKSSKKS